MLNHQQHVQWDEKRDLIIPGDYTTTLDFCVRHFITLANEAIEDHGNFFVALSGGSTPKALFERLCSEPYRSQIDWKKVHLFWSDERSAPPNDPESNYLMAMEAGLKDMPIPKEQIHRMQAEHDIQEMASLYEKTIADHLKGRPFDLIMLGMGEDGHTASLFPGTEALKITGKRIAANFIPEKNTWRMTMTYDCINEAVHSVIYVLGASKKYMLAKVLSPTGPNDLLPVQKVGTAKHRALWIADEAAASLLLEAK